MVIDRRFLAEEDIAAVKAEFRATVERARAGRGFRYEIRDMHEVLPTMTDRDAPVAAALARAVAAVLGRRGGVRRLARAPTTRSTSTASGGCRNCVAYGPGILDLAHQPDEYVGVDDMLDAATVMAPRAGRPARRRERREAGR